MTITRALFSHSCLFQKKKVKFCCYSKLLSTLQLEIAVNRIGILAQIMHGVSPWLGHSFMSQYSYSIPGQYYSLQSTRTWLYYRHNSTPDTCTLGPAMSGRLAPEKAAPRSTPENMVPSFDFLGSFIQTYCYIQMHSKIDVPKKPKRFIIQNGGSMSIFHYWCSNDNILTPQEM